MTLVVRAIILSTVMTTWVAADVAINEIFYNAPDDLDELEYIELKNTGDKSVTLDGWKLSGEIKYSFPPGTILKPGELMVIAKNRSVFKEFYDVDATGEFKKSLSNQGGEIRLSDAEGKLIEAVTYLDHSPWPVAADGYSASIERINASSSAAFVSNWAPSKLSKDYSSTPSGSPGKENSVAASIVPPQIRSVQWHPKTLQAGDSLTVTVTPNDVQQIRSAVVLYQYVAPGKAGIEQRVQLRTSGDKLSAMLPAGSEPNRLLRFRIVAQSVEGGVLEYPHSHEIRPAFTAYVAADSSDLKPAKVPVAHFFFVGADQYQEAEQYREQNGFGGDRDRFRGRGFGGPPPRRFEGPGGFGPRGRRGYFALRPAPLLPQGAAALIYTDPATGDTQVYDFINIVRRKSGWKVRFHKDHLLRGMNTINFLYEPDERTVVNEVLSYELYGLAGNTTYGHGLMRVAINGLPVGYHLYFEQPNANFFKRNKINHKGDLYKLIWTGDAQMSPRVPEQQRWLRPDITSRYEKKSNRHEGHDDLIAVIEALENAKSDDETWQLIEKHFDVDQVINYFAVNSLISHWDGFFNNYFAYFDREGTGKWSLYPWDQDSTWSQRGGSPYELYEMPIFFGAEGATPDGIVKLTAAERQFNRGGGFGPPRFGGGGFRGPRRGRGYGWWRPGGDFSRPLLANPTFYARFTQRLDELTQTVFTPAQFRPRIDQLRTSLQDEFPLRSRIRNGSERAAIRDLDRIIAGLYDHLENRRDFLRTELEK